MVWRHVWRRHSSADRTNVDDTPRTTANEWHESLDDADMADEIDLHLRTQLIERQELDRPAYTNTRVVHQTAERPATKRFPHLRCGRSDTLRLRDVDRNRRDALRRTPQRLRICWFSDPSKHAMPALAEVECTRPADSRRGAGDQNGPRFIPHGPAIYLLLLQNKRHSAISTVSTSTEHRSLSSSELWHETVDRMAIAQVAL